MKQIFLMRHAKSSWSDPAQSDRQRPLNNRGRAACKEMGRWMVACGFQPHHAIISDAQRTRETWEGLSPFLDHDVLAPDFESALYLAGPDTMLELLRATPDTAASVLMIAHQPGTGALASMLSGDDICAGCASAFNHYPTAAVALLEVDIENWSDLRSGVARFRSFTCPKNLT